MKILFINRENELNFLESKWREDSPQLIIIYGKRRIGKTELCIQFARNKPHIYYLCERLPVKAQLKKLTLETGSYFNDEFIPKEGFDDFETLFKYITKKNEKILLIIDEFSYLAEIDPSIPATFQKCWDLYLKDSKVFLILCGSSISMMEQSALTYKAPLYGRRTGQLLVRPFRFKELYQMFKDKSFEDILQIYSTVGGTPMYLNRFLNKSYKEVLKNDIFLKGQPLYEEVEFLLREELKEPRNYFSILQALSLGKHKLSEIINETGFDKGTVSRYIAILMDLHIVKKEIPVTEKVPEKSRKGIYTIDDNFVNFWFRFVFRNRSFLEEYRISEVYSKVKQSLNELLSKNYEKVACEILLGAVGTKLNFEKCGRWWDKDREIDVIALNEQTKEILFGEVKWSNKKVGTNVYSKLKEKAGFVDWNPGNRKEYFALFSKSGFTKEMIEIAMKENVILIEKSTTLLVPEAYQ